MPAEVTSKLTGEWMTPRRRFLSALFRGHVDKVPTEGATAVAVTAIDRMGNASEPVVVKVPGSRGIAPATAPATSTAPVTAQTTR